MNSTTFLIRFGISPDGFELNNFEPIKTDKGFLYYIEQSKKHIDCPYCNCKNVFIKGYYYRTINCSGNEIINESIKIKKVRFQCRSCNKTFSPTIKGIDPYNSISNFNKNVIRLNFYSNINFTTLAKMYHCSISQIISIFDESFSFVPRLKLSRILCIDEFHFSTNDEMKYCCILSDFETGKIIDILKSRQLNYLIEYFSKIPENELKSVDFFVSDMYDAYKTIKDRFLPKAKHIVDKFHIIIQLTRAIKQLRVICMNNFEKGSIYYNFMKTNWKCFESRQSNIPNKFYHYKKGNRTIHFTDLIFECIKYSDSLWSGYLILQDLYSYNHYKNFEDSLKFIRWIYSRLLNTDSPLLKSVGKTYKKWEIGIAQAFTTNHYQHNITNSISEGNNNTIKTVLKNAYGFKNFERFRKRALLILRNK